MIKNKKISDNWETVIGLEVHAQINSTSKLFSSASTKFGSSPNSQVSFIDAGFPGMLPVINKYCVEQAIKTGLSLNAKVNLISVFARKNYFYADLPAGYQISQHEKPIISDGYIEIDLKNNSTKKITIQRLHLEQDAGKSIHDLDPNKSFIDFNRAGVPLMEIVTNPDISNAEEAAAFLKKLRSLLRYLKTCDGNMEEGSLRVDINVSVKKTGDPLGTRTEIKNLNSIRFMAQAINYEINRQIQLIEEGKKVKQETRLFDTDKNITRPMRSKEEAHDYRYFPDPDLPPLVIFPEEIKKIKESLPELPDQKLKKFINIFKLPTHNANIIANDSEIANFYENVLSYSKNWETSTIIKELPTKNIKTAKLVSNWLLGELFSILNQKNLPIAKSKISAKDFAELMDLIQDNIISGKIAKTVFTEMWKTNKTAKNIIQEQKLQQVTDSSILESCIKDILIKHQNKVIEYHSGKEKLFDFFIGQVMKEMKGKANPSVVNKILKDKLKQ